MEERVRYLFRSSDHFQVVELVLFILPACTKVDARSRGKNCKLCDAVSRGVKRRTRLPSGCYLSTFPSVGCWLKSSKSEGRTGREDYKLLGVQAATGHSQANPGTLSPSACLALGSDSELWLGARWRLDAAKR
jgi:hypothetical protein